MVSTVGETILILGLDFFINDVQGLGGVIACVLRSSVLSSYLFITGRELRRQVPLPPSPPISLRNRSQDCLPHSI